MIHRQLDPAKYSGCLYDAASNTYTFLLYHYGTSQIAGFHTYKPDAPKKAPYKGFDPRELRYFTHSVEGQIPLFGVESLYLPGPLYVVEGVFDAVALHNIGRAAVAVLGSRPTRLLSWFRVQPRPVVAVEDGDEGSQLRDVCPLSIRCNDDEDPSSMPAHELLNLIERFEEKWNDN